MSLTGGLFNSGLFKGRLFNGGIFQDSSTVSIVSLLFGSGEVGLLYDPSDFSTLWKNTGSRVTSVAQSINAVLDKSQGLLLGPELTSVASSWTGSATWTVNAAAGRATCTGQTVSGDDLAIGSLTGNVGEIYQANFTIESVSGPGFSISSSRCASVPFFTTPGTYTTLLVIIVSGTGSLAINGSTGSAGVISGISIKKISGNHAYQATTASHPILTSGNVINYDGVDDYLRTVFVNLGTNVTIARSISGVGASILTGQTIGAGNWDDSTDHCGLVIVNRALTSEETSALTAYLNEKAGV